MNVQKFKAAMVLKGINGEQIAKAMCISEATFYRKLKGNGEDFTQGEMSAAIGVLDLDRTQAYDIFFAGEVS